jgi:tRNA threonylcarbamoyl adenosine modification protein (Sua5/YciO/YrdC/YwlC family)
MTERIELRAQGPKPRLIGHIVAVLVRGGLIAYPTDSGYALGWRSENRKAQERVVRLRELEGRHHFTYCCRSISDISRYARVSNWAHRLIRQLTPGPYTFILPATTQVPRTHRQRRPATIGIRIPDHEVVQAILQTIDEPILSCCPTCRTKSSTRRTCTTPCTSTSTCSSTPVTARWSPPPCST